VAALSLEKAEAAERADHDRTLYMDLKAPAYARIIAEALLLMDDGVQPPSRGLPCGRDRHASGPAADADPII
jgi:hypothetical protein